MSTKLMNQNNVMAGSFVIAGVLLAVAMSFILGDLASKFGEKKSYVIRFPTSVGVMGLEAGADVTFAGLNVGSVISVGMHYQEDQVSGVRVPEAMDVQIQLIADLTLYEDAIADLTPPILGGISRINIASAGTGAIDQESGREVFASDAGGVLDEGEILMGRFAPSILTQMGLGAEEAKKIRDVIHKFPKWSDRVTETTDFAAATTKRISEMTAKLQPKFNAGVDDGQSTIENIRVFSDRLNGEDGWSNKVDTIVASIQDASGKLSPAIDDAQEAISTTREMIDENRGKVGRIMDNVEMTTESVRFVTIERANNLLADGALALGSAHETVDEIKGIVIENRPRVNTTMVNVQQLSLQGKLMVEELKSQPWRLLQQPKKEDLRREPLYEAARIYAGAVSDLRSASESLDTAVRLAGGKGSDSATSKEELTITLMRLAKIVEQAYDRYEFAERGLLEVLADSP